MLAEPGGAPPEVTLPQPIQLRDHYEADTWILLCGPVSSPTRPGGDWRAYPHLSYKAAWKQHMEPRATAFAKCLQVHNIYVDECLTCKQQGRNMRADFCEHVIGHFHFKDLQLCGLGDGEEVEVARQNLWQAFCIPGGGVRFNHADGSIEMYHGRGELLRPGAPAALTGPAPVLPIAAPGVAPLPPEGDALQARTAACQAWRRWRRQANGSRS